jgi:hypothetical protein
VALTGGAALPAAAAPAKIPNVSGQWSVATVTSPTGPVSVSLRVTRQTGGSFRGTYCETRPGATSPSCVTVKGSVDARKYIRVNVAADNERVAQGTVIDAAHVQLSLNSPQEMFAEQVVVFTKG